MNLLRGYAENEPKPLTFRALLGIQARISFDTWPILSGSKNSDNHGSCTWVDSTNSRVHFEQHVLGLGPVETLEQRGREPPLEQLVVDDGVSSLPSYSFYFRPIFGKHVINQEIHFGGHLTSLADVYREHIHLIPTWSVQNRQDQCSMLARFLGACKLG